MKGISSFYGSEWTTYTKIDGLVDDYITSITQDNKGSMWFGTKNAGVSQLLPDGEWKNYSTDKGLANFWVTSVLEAYDSNMWFSTMGGGVSVLNRKWKFLKQLMGLQTIG